MTVYLNDLGIMCALGDDRESVLRNFLDGSRAGLRNSEKYSTNRAYVVGELDANLPALPAALSELDCRNNRLALAVLMQIADSVTALKKRVARDRIAVVMGTSTSGIGASEIAFAHFHQHQQWPKQFHYRQQQLGSLAECVARLLDVTGPTYTVSTACSSSANALASARRLLALDVCDAVIVGGVDTLCQMTVQGFASLESLSDGYCNPFSANRDGINIGEAGAIFVMSREPGPVKLLGVGASSDAHHISAPDPEGRGAIAAMTMALQQARCDALEIDYVNLHGTATRQNDAMESIAVNTIFGSEVACSSSKGMTGHTLGAAGALEAGLCWLLLAQNAECRLPPHVWDEAIDPQLKPLALTRPQQTAKRLQICLSNSFAFGGNNASVVLGK
ncbi:MAG: beta-ketoacyl-[acyl-carrier-protein] synthase family protein [Spongiibacteraceae bacterium]